MRSRTLWFSLLLLLSCAVVLSGCGSPSLIMPMLLRPGIDVGVEAKVPEEVLQQVESLNMNLQDLNTTIKDKKILDESTLDLGHRLVDVIGDFNQQLKDGLLDENSLRLIDRGLTVVEKGVKVGLDEPTQEILTQFADVVDRQPEEWGGELRALTQMLGWVGSDLSEQISQQISSLATQVANDTARLTAGAAATVGCTIDVAGSKARRQVQEAAGEFMAGLLRLVAKKGPSQEVARIPSVCTILPLNVQVTLKDGLKVVSEDTDILEIHGFNFSDAVVPDVAVVSGTGKRYDISLRPYFETEYVWRVNLGDKDLTAVDREAAIEISWKLSPDLSAAAQLSHRKVLDFIIPSPLVAAFTADREGGTAPLSVSFFDDSRGEPSRWTWDFGDGETKEITNSKEPVQHTYEYPGTYTVTLTIDNEYYRPESIVRRSLVKVSYPPAPVASFSVSRISGPAPLEVSLAASSDREVNAWQWDLGDGTRSDKQNVVYEYPNPGRFVIRLITVDKYGQASGPVEKVIEVLKPPVVYIKALDLKTNTVLGEADRELVLPAEIRTNGFDLELRGTTIRAEGGSSAIVTALAATHIIPPEGRTGGHGQNGSYKEAGGAGGDGERGKDGAAGTAAGDVTIRANRVEGNLSIAAVGGKGGPGGDGGDGGNGGTGGKGTNASSSAVTCRQGAGNGHTGGAAGDGGSGGRGGQGGPGGRVFLYIGEVTGVLSINSSGGSGGEHGKGGQAGRPGAGGPGGDKDLPYCRSNGNTGATGALGQAGDTGSWKECKVILSKQTILGVPVTIPRMECVELESTGRAGTIRIQVGNKAKELAGGQLKVDAQALKKLFGP